MTGGERVLLKDLIDIPERVHRGDFVLKLADGLSHDAATVDSYVVTPQLKKCFDEALAFIKAAVTERSSRACYLHGSFGSGKSHFMAVLNLILAGNRPARSIAELSTVIARHNAWTEGRRFLMVPYHMIGARDMESAVLGQYADYVRARHPEAPVPAFYLAESLFQDALVLRRQMGDAGFFGKLNEGAGGGGWGALDGGWDAVAFETAMREAPSGPERQRLVADLIQHFFTSYGRVAAGSGEAFVSLDEGLLIMSQHAQSLGYDAVILFLDELILWLATHAGNVDFVSSEGSKLSKLVEAQASGRPIPLVSFVARQRDLRDLVGEHLAGALNLRFADVLKHWEARFHRITLEDRNLPVIAEKRLLRPKSETARQTLHNAFEDLAGKRQDVLATLLGQESERALFRQVYPFSPALVQALVAVSSLLQRERTALKLMLQLLVDRREELAVGDIVPVGDLWDVIVEGDEPFTDGTRIQFDNAKKLWSQRLLPMLEHQHKVRWQDLAAGTADPGKAEALRNDARLLKTLLLSALVPQEESLRALTPARLAALNHGSVRTPIPGREGGTVLTKLRQWGQEVGEIKLGEDSTNPTVAIEISGVDTGPIIANAEKYDNEGNRRKKVRETLLGLLKVSGSNDLFVSHRFLWRNTWREIDIVLDSLFDIAPERLAGRPDTWTLGIGLPLGAAPQRTAADARAQLPRLASGTQTVVWLPSMLSARALADLKTLVIIDHLLAGERFDDAARHLSMVDRQQARALLGNRQSQLKQRLHACLDVAYGIAGEPRDAVDGALSAEEHLVSLNGAFAPRVPVGANLSEALQALLTQLYDHLYPAHPRFEREMRLLDLRKVLEAMQSVIASPERRWHVADRTLRQTLQGIANPLRLANMGQDHLSLEHHWVGHFDQRASRDGGPLTVGKLRRFIDEPKPMGLPKEVQNLLILCFAAQTDRSFYRHGGQVRPMLERIDDELELKEQPLPAEADWDRARKLGESLLGLTSAAVLNAASVDRLVQQVRERSAAASAPLGRLLQQIEARLRRLASDPDAANRVVTLRAARALLAELAAAETPQAAVQALARAPIRTSEGAMQAALAKAGSLDTFLQAFEWDLIESIGSLSDAREGPAQAILERTRTALAADEQVQPLEAALKQERASAARLLADTGGGRASPPTSPEAQPRPQPRGQTVIAEGEASDLGGRAALEAVEALRRRLATEPGARLSLSWRLTRGKHP